TQGVCHACMPRSWAAHLWRVIRDNYAVKVVALQDGQDSNHVHVAFVNEGLPVMRGLSHDVSKVKVSDVAPAAVLIDGIVHIAFGHLRNGPNTKLQRIAVTGSNVQQALIHVWLIHQSRLAPHGWHGGIVGMRG